jgi:hypothetical protein
MIAVGKQLGWNQVLHYRNGREWLAGCKGRLVKLTVFGFPTRHFDCAVARHPNPSTWRSASVALSGDR